MFKDNLTDYNHGVYTRVYKSVFEFFKRLFTKNLEPTVALFDIWDLEIYSVHEVVYSIRSGKEKKIKPLKY